MVLSKVCQSQSYLPLLCIGLHYSWRSLTYHKHRCNLILWQTLAFNENVCNDIELVFAMFLISHSDASLPVIIQICTHVSHCLLETQWFGQTGLEISLLLNKKNTKAMLPLSVPIFYVIIYIGFFPPLWKAPPQTEGSHVPLEASQTWYSKLCCFMLNFLFCVAIVWYWTEIFIILLYIIILTILILHQ